MTDHDGLGSIARRWLRAKTTELLTTDNRTRADARAELEAAERAERDKAVEKVVLTAFPGIQRMQQRQELAQVQRRTDERNRVLALPHANVQLRVQWADAAAATKGAAGWSGELPARGSLEDGMRHVELLTGEGQEPALDNGDLLRGVSFAVPGFHGDGRYDLLAAARTAEAAGEEFDPFLWCLAAGNDDESLYWVPSTGAAATVDVAVDGSAFTLWARMTSAVGDADVVVQVTGMPPVSD